MVTKCALGYTPLETELVGGSHVSLFIVVMKGDFDEILEWPFKHKVTFQLLNQNGGKDIVDAFRADPQSSSFRKPISDMNIATGVQNLPHWMICKSRVLYQAICCLCMQRWSPSLEVSSLQYQGKNGCRTYAKSIYLSIYISK